MPVTWAQWGMPGAGAAQNSTLYGAIPYIESPAHWSDSALLSRCKMRARFFVDDPASDSFTGRAYFDDDGFNYCLNTTTGVATDWDKTWALAGEMPNYPVGDPVPVPDMASIKSPRFKGGHWVCTFGSVSVILYGVELGVVFDDDYDAADDRVERTPRTGTVLYGAYAALCSYMVSTVLLGGHNKLVESGRWRIAGPIMGDR